MPPGTAPDRRLLVALTGGIGAGKSTAAHILKEWGADMVDADRVAHAVLHPEDPASSPLLARIRDIVGDDAFGDDGALDRTAVAARVFHDDALRIRYVEMLRPAITSAMLEALTIAQSRVSAAPVIHEIPLLSGNLDSVPWRYDEIVTVEADDEIRRARLTQTRGYSDDEAVARIRAQGSRDDRERLAHIVVENDGGRADLVASLATLWERWTGTRPVSEPQFSGW